MTLIEAGVCCSGAKAKPPTPAFSAFTGGAAGAVTTTAGSA